MAKLVGDGVPQSEAWSGKLQPDLIRCAHYFFYAYLFQKAFDVLNNGTVAAQTTKKWVEELLCVYGLYELLEDLPSYMQTGYVTGLDVLTLKQKMRESLARLRPEAAGIVDAFGLIDEEINSALGCYDGNVYERLLDIIRKNPLN